MGQEIQNANSNKKQLIIAIAISVIATALIAGFGIYFIMSKSVNKKDPIQNNQTQLPQSESSETNAEEPIIANEDVENQTPAIDKKIYFANGWEGKYNLFNLDTGSATEFIPNGYEIIGQHDYDPLPKFLILKKDSNLFSFELENQLVNKIFILNNLLLKDNEQARIYPSITDKNKFFLAITEHNLSQVSDFDGSSPIINTRSYYFDASTNNLSKANNIDLSCAKYDSKNQRFFTWPCGEGIGSSIPLSIAKLNGQKQKEIISLSEFGLLPDDVGRAAVEYNDGLFFAISKNSNSFDKIIVVDPKQQEPQKEVYAIADIVKSKMEDSYPYSMALIKSQNTIVIGGDHFITLLRFKDNQIIESKTIPEQELYANFIFPYDDTLYYQSISAKAIRSINLRTWQVERTIPIKTNEAVTLLKINK